MVSAVKKVHRLSGQQTTHSASSSIYTGFCSCMVDGATDASAGSSATTFTRILCWSSLRFSFRSRMASQDRSSSLTGSRLFTTLCGLHGLACLHTLLSKTSMISTAIATHKSTKLVRRASTSTLKCSGDGSSSRSGMA